MDSSEDIDNIGIAQSRSKRTQKDKYGRKAAFERLRELKGSKHKYEVGDVHNVYDVVEEKEYAKRRQNIVEEDWIVDDGSGYVDDGREIFDDGGSDDDDEIFTSKKNKGKSGHRKTSKQSETRPSSGNLKRMFANMPMKKRKIESQEMSEAEKALLDECLSEEVTVKPKIGTGAPKFTYERTPPIRTPTQIKKFVSSYKEAKGAQRTEDDEQRVPLAPVNKEKLEIIKCPTSRSLSEEVNVTRVGIENIKHDDMDDGDDDLFLGVCEQEENILKRSIDNKAEEKKVETEPAPPKSLLRKQQLTSGWEYSSNFSGEKSDSICDVHIDSSQLPLTINSDGDQVLRFFWLDAYEDHFSRPGVVYLFGKIFIESAKTYVSCCLTVKNIEKRVFLLPRLKKINLKTKEEGEEVTMSSVYEEFNNDVAKKFKILQFKSKMSTKKYCFEKLGVPDEAQYMEVRYSANLPNLPSKLEGETFSHVFGTNTSSLELLLLDRKLKGPGWIDVKVPQPSTPPISWCKIEAIASKPDCISPVTGLSAPPLSVVSLSFRTVINSKTKQNEICLVSCLYHQKFHIDKPAASHLFQDHWCALSRPADMVLPWDFKSKLLNFKGTKVEKNESETLLLGFLLAKIFKMDPDIIIGHDIFGFDLNVLLHRIQANKIPQWSRIGRLKRKEMPKLSNKGFAERQAVCGRLICDAKISAKELIRAKSYDLGPLIHQVLKVKEDERIEYTTEDVKKCFSSSDTIFQLVNATMQDAFYGMKIVAELNVLPLALQITNIAGNVMSRTLLGGRSERNEYLLLHAFSEKDFVCPDKQYGKSKQREVALAADDDDDSGGKTKKGKGKSSYAGGLVLEPKKGFYDKFILLLDFNSLYPSIIQEYNICFTTVQKADPSTDKEDILPDLPDQDLKAGILPTEIRKLVESRREVKKLMKQPDLSQELKQQYDIRQKALKLTANSMYGCLGFSNSRFFARHLASLITAKGREILLSTKDLVQKLNFEVIYGDTDSIMVNTNCIDYDQVFKLGNKIKQEVNKLHKLLELDIDGVFKYMLLLKKKKYAAVTMTKLPNGDILSEKELKGLDIVRRDWSELAANAGNVVLDQILSDQGPDERIENIHNHLERIKSELEEGKVGLDCLSITKQLTKNPSDYPDKNSLPHVQVALRMNSKEGKRLRQGDTVPYIICQDGSNLTAVQRAYHVDEVKSNKDLKIDYNYYLAHQIHPVVSRLCDPIDGTDSARIAECLGLDPSGYRSRSSVLDETANELPTSDISEEEKYRLCQRFAFQCPSPECQMIITVDAPTRGTGSSAEFLLQLCPDPKCKTVIYKHVSYIQNKLRKEIRRTISLYYDCWLMCEDPACGIRTRSIPLKFNRGFPLCNVCQKSVLFREYTESQLYTQLCFYEYIFDYEKGCKGNKELRNKDEALKRAYYSLQNEVQSHLNLNAFSIIDLGSIFANLYVKKAKN